MKVRTVVGVCVQAILVVAALECQAMAQDAVEEKRPRFEFGLGGWVITHGETTWAHNASTIPGLGNPTSKLTYKDDGTNIMEGTARLWMTPKWFGRLTGGFGAIGGGRLTDSDYLSADGGSPSSQTISDIRGGSTWYVNADVGLRAVEFRNSRGWLDVFAGYQFWYQRSTATGLGQAACTTAGQTTDLDPGRNGTQPLCPAPAVSNSVDVITNTSNWHSIRVGGAIEYRLTRRLSLQSTIALIPISIIDNKDVHHLRADLSKNPSLSMLGYGIGADADVGARVMVVRNLYASVGYRVWWNRMLNGNVTFHNNDGSSNEFPLTEFQTFRHGLTVGLNYSF